jgi:hypothetical protein
MTEPRYPNIPGSVPGSATSEDAADSAMDFAHSLADWCETWFKLWTRAGRLMTCEECELASKKMGGLGKHQSISARIRTDLFIKRQCLWKAGTTYAGVHVKVWYTSDTSRLQTDNKGRIVYRTRPNTSGRQAWVYGWGYRQ